MRFLLRPAARYGVYDPLTRVLAWRAHGLRSRLGQALLVGAFALISTRDPAVWLWFVVSASTAFIDSIVSRRLLNRPRLRVGAALACATHLASSVSFLGVIAILFSRPDPMRLAEGGLLLCAVCLNSAMMCCGSGLATAVLVGPAGALLVASPFIAQAVGLPIATNHVAVLSGASAIYVVFIIRLAATIAAEGEALRSARDEHDRQRAFAEVAGREAQAGREAAEAANRAKSDFLAVMSHEIRTPLNGVLGMAQAMGLAPLSEVQRSRLAVIQESGGALLGLLDDLLDLARIEAGRLDIEVAEFDLHSLAMGAHAAFVAEAERKGLAFELAIAETLPQAYRGDARRVRQILWNLISNALKFTHAGEVVVIVSRHACGVRMTVRDTGIGIAPDRVPGLFESFAQADASVTRSYGGAGLGLAICRQLVELMDGVISVDSAPGVGSTFIVDLPLRVVVSAQAEGTNAAPSAAQMRVLSAEDNPVNQMVLKALLAQVGIEPVVVADGAEALAAWRTGDWDLILMDVRMPVMDGPSAARAIRAEETEAGRARTPIVAVTANAMTHQVESYRADGIDDVIAKPINVSELFAAVTAAAAGGYQAASDNSSESFRASSARR